MAQPNAGEGGKPWQKQRNLDSERSFAPGQIFPSLLRFIAASFAFVYCMIKMYGEFVEELKDRIEGFFILDIIKWLTFFVELCLY